MIIQAEQSVPKGLTALRELKGTRGYLKTGVTQYRFLHASSNAFAVSMHTMHTCHSDPPLLKT